MPDTELAEELLQIEEADAWFEYLEATRGQTENRYGEVEPWAWARLDPTPPRRARPPRPPSPGRGVDARARRASRPGPRDAGAASLRPRSAV